MDNSTLAKKMLQWEQHMIAANRVGEEIKAAVLEMGKTQVVGNVRATLKNPRRSFDYETAVQESPKIDPSVVDDFTTTEVIPEHTVVKTDWKGICDAYLKKEEVPFTVTGQKSVTLKLEK